MPQRQKFRSFEDARAYVQSLKLESQTKWNAWSKTDARPKDIPSHPADVYKEKWKGWGDFLGTGRKGSHDHNFLPFEKARAYAHSLRFTNGNEWSEWAKTNARPENIPACPFSKYRNEKEWKGMGDFLGTGHKAFKDHKFLSFEEARTYAQSLKFNSRKDWVEWAKSDARPENIPANPGGKYKKDWTSWGDFLGSGRKGPKDYKFLSFVEARTYAQSLDLRTEKEWTEWSKRDARPENLPANPSSTYKKEWKGWGDFLRAGKKIQKDSKFLPFKEARTYVRSLELKTGNEWIAWTKSDARPENIPASPIKSYKEEWKGLGDFLGTGRVASQNRTYRSFEESRAYSQSLGFKKAKEWLDWSKTGAKPDDIPTNLWDVYKEKWKGWGDFLGTGRKAPKDCKFRPFEEARVYAHSLGLNSEKEWKKWIKTNRMPSDIPADPYSKYRNEGWKGWGDFLGTGRKSPQGYNFCRFEEARIFARSLRLNSGKEWRQWAKTDARPEDIPADPSDPEGVYKEDWTSWGDFLGTGHKGPKDHNFLPFEDARIYAQSLKFKSRNDWVEWAKTDSRPDYIPAGPAGPYKKEWTGWGDFLGTGWVAPKDRNYRSFEDARAHVHSLKLDSQTKWNEWAKTDARPKDIPSHPPDVYKNEWISWGDWCGYNGAWTVNAIRAFVKSLLPYIDGLTPPEMYVLLQQNGLLGTAKYSKSKKFIEVLKSGKFPKEELEKFLLKQTSVEDDFNSHSNLDVADENLLASEHSISEEQIAPDEFELPIISTINVLTTIDSKLLSNLDEEAVDYFIKSAVAKIWKHTYVDETAAIQQLKYQNNEGSYSQKVKSLFLSEYKGAKELIIPVGYSSPLTPNLMQRHTAYLVKDRKRLGNWSGTGAGKTLSAILASRVTGAKITVICCPNNVISHWECRILETYPKSVVLKKNINLADSDDNPQYLILNYEFFQQANSELKLKKLLSGHFVDFIIIDEIHYSKQREVENISKRKKTIMSFLSEAAAKNNNLHVLGMSATPVINNLFEGKTLIELVTGFHHDDLQTKATVSNCISLYKNFVSYGIRWIPNYNYRLNIVTEDIDCSSYLPEIQRNCLDGKMLDLEIILTKAKLPFIMKNLKTKTIVYTHYVEGIVNILQDAIEQKGWKVGIFTGENKEGLEGFVEGHTDILLASSCAGTGVDGLQKVCNRLIVNSLPWTHSGFQQLKGRIYRQGQKYDHVDVLVPITFANINGKKWSWCESRWKRILFKKSIADAAVDGLIPEGHLRTPAQAYKDAMSWLKRLDGGNLYEIERSKISIMLSDEISQSTRRKIGDLVQMNNRINHAKSSDTNARFKKNPNEWEQYHAIYREERKNWPIIPYKIAIDWLKARPHWSVGDFGCGEAHLAAELDNYVISFDHVAINSDVISCDMTKVPLDDYSLDAAVFSLSLMGLNFIDYLRESHRCLKLDGQLWIAEPTSRLKNPTLFCDLLFRLGFNITSNTQKSKFTFIRAIKTEREINEEAIKELQDKTILD